ncbi:MAG: DUF6382 domain-containing protein [Muricomes sp.]
MKAGYEKELNRVCLHIDLSRLYEEDYQIHMLRENKISGLLEITGCGIDGKSRYSYVVTGMISMKNRFETSAIKKEDMLVFVNRLMEIVKLLGRYMLSPDRLLLYPEFIFWGEDTWFFCYLPGRKKQVGEAFHVMTEYFVKKLDYEETEGIFLAYELHKATLQENYDLEKIMDEYRMHEEKRKSSETDITKREEGILQEENIFSVEEEEYEQAGDTETLREMGGWLEPWKRTASKLKKKRWGNWKDLILETDERKDER